MSAWLGKLSREEQTPGAKAHFDGGLTAPFDFAQGRLLKPCPIQRRFDIRLAGQASRLSLRELGATGGRGFGCGWPSFSIPVAGDPFYCLADLIAS